MAYKDTFSTPFSRGNIHGCPDKSRSIENRLKIIHAGKNAKISSINIEILRMYSKLAIKYKSPIE